MRGMGFCIYFYFLLVSVYEDRWQYYVGMLLGASIVGLGYCLEKR